MNSPGAAGCCDPDDFRISDLAGKAEQAE